MKNRQKIKALEAKKTEIEAKLALKMKGFRGVIHESAASELKDMEIKVLRSHLGSIEKEIESLKK